MITIEQLLESVDLDFEPRWVTQNAFGVVAVRSGKKPHPESPKWIGEIREYQDFGKIKLAEFAGKDWTECIYEVPQKVVISKMEITSKIEKLPEFDRTEASIFHAERLYSVVNELVDAVNELKAITQPIILSPDLTDEDLRKTMRDPKYWRDKDSATIQKVQNGFNKLYGDKN